MTLKVTSPIPIQQMAIQPIYTSLRILFLLGLDGLNCIGVSIGIEGLQDRSPPFYNFFSLNVLSHNVTTTMVTAAPPTNNNNSSATYHQQQQQRHLPTTTTAAPPTTNNNSSATYDCNFRLEIRLCRLRLLRSEKL